MAESHPTEVVEAAEAVEEAVEAVVPVQLHPTFSAPAAVPIDGAEAEPDEYANSAYGDAASVHGSTASMVSSILKYRQENGRSYHAYKVNTRLVLELSF